MANSLLTTTAITREALAILHQKANFIGNINRQYDSSYAVSGAKIGDSLRIRLPNQYTVRSGATLSAQDTTEASTTLQISTQKGVDLNFTSVDLTLSLDDFKARILDPALSVLTANVEYDALTMYKDVYNQVSNVGAAATFANILNGRKKLVDSLTPLDSYISCILNTQANVDLVDALKGLFNDSAEVSKMYKEGKIGRGSSMTFYENTLLPRHTTGSDASAYLINGASQTGATLTVDTGTGTFKKGDVVTIANVFAVHPETKVTSSVLQQFVITADVSGSATSLPISPAIVATGATQNVSGSPADNAAITKVGTASQAHDISMAFHRDAFTFATADLVMPGGVDMGARHVLDGISMRLVRQYDINNDKLPSRLDILYGYKTIRAQMACRFATN